AAADVEAGATTRTTLRLPDHLKTQAETAAARDGVSVNTWLVRAVAAALEQSTGRPAAQARPQQRGSARVTGWVR
uniref:toxin-antitoxin system HicB family antitoxin n=2 Tax=Cellulosimicrobium TaxID=157920 RepID=UPI0005B775EA